MVDATVTVQKQIGDLGAAPDAELAELPVAFVHKISQAFVTNLGTETDVELLEGGVARGRQVLHALIGDGGATDVDVDESTKRRCARLDSFSGATTGLEALGRFGRRRNRGKMDDVVVDGTLITGGQIQLAKLTRLGQARDIIREERLEAGRRQVLQIAQLQRPELAALVHFANGRETIVGQLRVVSEVEVLQFSAGDRPQQGRDDLVVDAVDLSQRQALEVAQGIRGGQFQESLLCEGHVLKGQFEKASIAPLRRVMMRNGVTEGRPEQVARPELDRRQGRRRGRHQRCRILVLEQICTANTNAKEILLRRLNDRLDNFRSEAPPGVVQHQRPQSRRQQRLDGLDHGVLRHGRAVHHLQGLDSRFGQDVERCPVHFPRGDEMLAQRSADVDADVSQGVDGIEVGYNKINAHLVQGGDCAGPAGGLALPGQLPAALGVVVADIGIGIVGGRGGAAPIQRRVGLPLLLQFDLVHELVQWMLLAELEHFAAIAIAVLPLQFFFAPPPGILPGFDVLPCDAERSAPSIRRYSIDRPIFGVGGASALVQHPHGDGGDGAPALGGVAELGGTDGRGRSGQPGRLALGHGAIPPPDRGGEARAAGVAGIFVLVGGGGHRGVVVHVHVRQK